MLPIDADNARLVGRVWRPELAGPSVVLVRQGDLIDITATYPTMTDLLAADVAAVFDQLEGERLGPVTDFMHPPEHMADTSRLHLLAPCDLQALKACGVTFARSMVERVIDEKTSGDPTRAHEIRSSIGELIGDSLANVKAGSETAAQIKAVLIKEGLWSQYLEVGIGPDAEVFTKSQPMSAVGYGAYVGIHPISRWNNPEPEIVLAIDANGKIKGATLGNDVNLRDVEGRSALLLGKAKDNNASCAIGPFIRLFDAKFGIADIETALLTMKVIGNDGFIMDGASNMAEISRSPADLSGQTINRNHQYPDGLMLFLGTMFAPTQDRTVPGSGFTHQLGDVVEVSTLHLGVLRNIVGMTNVIEPWQFGTRALMSNLAARGLLGVKP